MASNVWFLMLRWCGNRFLVLFDGWQWDIITKCGVLYVCFAGWVMRYFANVSTEIDSFSGTVALRWAVHVTVVSAYQTSLIYTRAASSKQSLHISLQHNTSVQNSLFMPCWWILKFFRFLIYVSGRPFFHEGITAWIIPTLIHIPHHYFLKIIRKASAWNCQ